MNILALDLATLHRLYVDDRKTTREIGAAYGIGHRSVGRLLQRHGIVARARGQRRSSIDERFAAKFVVLPSGCWQWVGCLSVDGYGNFRGGLERAAHRWSYRRFRGAIPDRFEVDHLCRFRACVNPDHLEAVPKVENIRRGTSFAAVNASKTHCPNGHPLVVGRGQRVCPICRRASSLAYYHRQRSAA